MKTKDELPVCPGGHSSVTCRWQMETSYYTKLKNAAMEI